MPGVVKKTKQKAQTKAMPDKKGKKFISESLQKRKSKGHKKAPKHKRRGVVYIKHLPHGFFEEQLRGYFSQFGAITRLRLARSPKTLNSKGYAFIEFRYPEVAEIAADAMNNYLMFKNIIKTRFIPPSDIKHDYFRSSVSKVKKDGEKVFTSKLIEAREIVIQNTNKLMTTEDEQKRITKIAKKINKSKKKFADLGIDYDIDEVAGNMGEEMMKAVETNKPKTIANTELGSEDEADETFDPANVDVDSGDDFEDFEYNSDNTDEDDDIDVNIDEDKLQEAIKIAQKAITTATMSTRSGKRKEETEPEEEVTTKKSKTTKKGKENKTVEVPVKKEAVKAAKGKKAPEPVKPETPPPKVSKRNAKKASPVAQDPMDKVEPKAAEKSQPKRGAKKIVHEVEIVAPAVPKGKKGKKAPQTPEPEDVIDKNSPKEKKATKAVKPKEAKKPVNQFEESPATPVKTKKLAKTSVGIEKKKPLKAAEVKKLKLAASLANVDEMVKAVKGKDIKKKGRK